MPTYHRPNQRSLLTVLAHAFHYVKGFHWIIAEDARIATPWIRDLLERFKFNYTHIACDRVAYCARHKDCRHVSAKGSVPRNCALMWLKQSPIKDGIIYFADDDNFYDSQLFEEVGLRRAWVAHTHEWVSEWVSGWVSEWVSVWVSECVSELVSEWVCECVSEWVSEWVS